MAQFRLQRYEALEAESQRLRALRDSTAGVSNRFIIGDVMDVDLDAFRERVLVDKGAGDGVFVGQAVLDSGGVFGQVARVEQLTSEVILVSDAVARDSGADQSQRLAHHRGRHRRHSTSSSCPICRPAPMWSRATCW